MIARLVGSTVPHICKNCQLIADAQLMVGGPDVEDIF